MKKLPNGLKNDQRIFKIKWRPQSVCHYFLFLSVGRFLSVGKNFLKYLDA